MNESPFLTQTECEVMFIALLENESYWIARTRKGVPPFYTMGAASYLDAQPVMGGVENYKSKARLMNGPLRTSFNKTYDLLLSKLGQVLGDTCWYPRDLALPGFHLFRSCIEYTFPIAVKHRDLQHRLLDRNQTRIQDVMSFTIPIKLPSKGGGLNVWDEAGQQHFRNYSLGRIYHFNNGPDHQIAPFLEHESGAWRVTLQGHGIKIDGHWQVYW